MLFADLPDHPARLPAAVGFGCAGADLRLARVATNALVSLTNTAGPADFRVAPPALRLWGWPS